MGSLGSELGKMLGLSWNSLGSTLTLGKLLDLFPLPPMTTICHLDVACSILYSFCQTLLSTIVRLFFFFFLVVSIPVESNHRETCELILALFLCHESSY